MAYCRCRSNAVKRRKCSADEINQFLVGRDDQIGCKVDLGGSIKSTYAESQATAGLILT
jgi:hypothetical protein